MVLGLEEVEPVAFFDFGPDVAEAAELAKNVRNAGTKGKMQGLKNDTRPAKKAIGKERESMGGAMTKGNGK